MFPVKVSLDRLVMIYKNVTLEEWDEFVTILTSNQFVIPKTVIKLGVSTGISSYRYNMNFGFGEGAIRVDYRHNTLAFDEKVADMRIEFNPAKLQYQDYDYECDTGKKITTRKVEPSKFFFKMLNTHFDKIGDAKKKRLTGEYSGHVRVIREFDVAFDYNVPIEKIIVKSLTGKEHSIYKGTHYWGNKHTHGYTKMYDKKKERNKNKDKWVDKYEHLTRIEYTFRTEGNVGVNELNRIQDFEIGQAYQISIMDETKLNKFEPTVKAYLLCYINGLMQFKEMSRRYQEKTKKALQDLAQINLDQILKQDFKKKILSTINKYIRL